MSAALAFNRALLAFAQRRYAALRAARPLRLELERRGWSHTAAAELTRIHVMQQEQKS
jgi:hypothetical protein